MDEATCSTCLTYLQEWVGYCFYMSADKENSIISLKILLWYIGIIPENLVIRTDNGITVYKQTIQKIHISAGIETGTYLIQYTRTERTHRIIPQDTKEETHLVKWFLELPGSRIRNQRWFVDYNQNRIHSAQRYLTPYEFISKLKMSKEKEEEKVINIGNEK